MPLLDLSKLLLSNARWWLLMSTIVTVAVPPVGLVLLALCLAMCARGLRAHRAFSPMRVASTLDGRTGVTTGLWNDDMLTFAADDEHRYLVVWDTGPSDDRWHSDRPIHADGRIGLTVLSE